MLNALSRAAIGALKASKSNLTPKIVQNELPKAMVATSSNCEYDVLRGIFSYLTGRRLPGGARQTCLFFWFTIGRFPPFFLPIMGQHDRGRLGFRCAHRSIVLRNGPNGRRRLDRFGVILIGDSAVL